MLNSAQQREKSFTQELAAAALDAKRLESARNGRARDGRKTSRRANKKTDEAERRPAYVPVDSDDFESTKEEQLHVMSEELSSEDEI